MPVKAAVFAISFIASCGTVAVAGLLAAGLQNWFGVSDLTFLVVWFVPLSFITAALAAVAFQRASRWPLLFRYVGGLGVGLLLGFLWTFCVARLMGPWWGAVSLPALICWMAGGASGVAGGIVLGPGASARSRVASIVGLLALAVAGVVFSKPLATHLSHDQTLTVRFLRWTPGTEPLTIETESDDALSNAEVALVRAAQPTGHLLVNWGSSRHGRGPAAAALILLKEPITRPVSIRQPDRASAVYVQGDQGFAVYPVDTKSLDREITLSPQEGGVWCSVRIANGGVQSGPVRIW